MLSCVAVAPFLPPYLTISLHSCSFFFSFSFCVFSFSFWQLGLTGSRLR